MSTEKIITMIYQHLGNNLYTSFNTKFSNSFIIILGTATQITEDSQLLSLLIALLSTINKSATLLSWLYYIVWWSYLAAALDYFCIWLTTPTVYNRTVLKNGSCCTVRPGKVSCLQKFRHFWMIIRDLFFESGSTEATKIKKNTAKLCHLYFWSNNSALFEHWNWKSSFKHRGWYVFARRKGVKI